MHTLNSLSSLTVITVISFLVFVSFFILGRAVDQAGLTGSFRVHVDIASLLTYILSYR